MAGAIEGRVNYNWHIADDLLVGSKVRYLSNFSAAPHFGERPESALPRRYRVCWERSLHRTDSGHSPWQREPLFVPPLALATPLAHSSRRSSTSPTTGGGAKSPLMQIWRAVSGAN